jgi:hypothetical protein
MSDNDLIRRGEVRDLLQKCELMGNHPNDPLTILFDALPPRVRACGCSGEGGEDNK